MKKELRQWRKQVGPYGQNVCIYKNKLGQGIGFRIGNFSTSGGSPVHWRATARDALDILKSMSKLARPFPNERNYYKEFV